MIEWISQYSGYLVLLGFFAAFAYITLSVYRPSKREELEKLRNIPFRDED